MGESRVAGGFNGGVERYSEPVWGVFFKPAVKLIQIGCQLFILHSAQFFILHSMHRGTVVNANLTDLEENKSLNKVIIFVFFAHKKYYRSFITLLLNH